MLVVGLTGGLGSGKSTAADLFAKHGAEIIDADVIARQVIEKGTDGFDDVVSTFGTAVLKDDGDIDRHSLAKVVFANNRALKNLEAIIHPRVRVEVNNHLASLRSMTGIAVTVVPLLVESGQYKVDWTVVVDCDEQVAVERVMNSRGWTEYDTRSRMVNQASRSERLMHADYVIDNGRSHEALVEQVDRCWKWLSERL